MMLSWNRLKRVLGYFPRAVWRLAWCRQRGQTQPVQRGELARDAGFAVRSPGTAPLQIPAGLDPGVAAAIRQSVEQARERFLSGIDLAPLAAHRGKGGEPACDGRRTDARPARFAVYSVRLPSRIVNEPTDIVMLH